MTGTALPTNLHASVCLRPPFHCTIAYDRACVSLAHASVPGASTMIAQASELPSLACALASVP